MKQPPLPGLRRMILARRIEVRQLLILGLLSCLAVNQLRIGLEGWGKFALVHPGYADFGNYYLYARVGLHQGWTHLYDLAAQRREWLTMGGSDVLPWFPMIYPPPVAWVVVPFTLLPLPAAYAAWFALLLGMVLLIWTLVSRGLARLTRWSFLAGTLAIYAVPFAMILGNVVILELTAIAVGWWLLGRNRQVAAGLVLTALVFKPQVAVVLPIVLLLLGRRRAATVWVLGCALIAAIATISTGLDGLHAYGVRILGAAANRPEFLVPQQLTLGGLLGRGPGLIIIDGLLLGLTLIGAFRQRRQGLAIPFACALAGSMAISPYLHFEDLATLLLAGAIASRAALEGTRRSLLLAGYLLLLAISYWEAGAIGAALAGLLFAVETGWLLSAVLAPISGSAVRELAPLGEIPLDRSA
jgi:glycosyl transferase family 87